MGFRPKNRQYQLQWAEDHELHGLVVMARAMRLGELLKLAEMAEQAKDKVSDIAELIERFSAILVSWNREDDEGNALPATAEGVQQIEDWEFMEILDAYMSAAVSVSEDLGKGSPSGGPSPVDTPPMDDL